MTKHVHARNTIAHLWASQSQDCGRTSSDNFSFTGPKLYSYAQPIAYILDREHYVLGEDRKTIVLLNSSSYSMTTNRHQSLARQASRHFRQIDVPDLDENMTYAIGRDGLVKVISAILEDVKRAASDAARPRIRQATRDAAISRANARRDDALLLLGLDKARRLGKPYTTLLRKLEKLANLDPSSFATPAAYAYALDKARLLDNFRRSVENARHKINALLEFSADGTQSAQQLLNTAAKLDTDMNRVRDNAKAALCAVPRALSRAYTKVAPQSAWRAEKAAAAKAQKVAHALATWNDKLPAMLSAADDKNAFINSEFIPGEYAMRRELNNADALVVTLADEPGHAERLDIMARLHARERAHMEEKDRARVAELMETARACFDRDSLEFGDFRTAQDKASAVLRSIGATPEIRAEAQTLFDKAAVSIADQESAELAAWRDGTRPHLSYYHPANKPNGAALRLSADGSRVETSNGADVPVDVCPRLWSLVGAVRAGGQDRAFTGYKLGIFSLDKIKADGTIHAGCHAIAFDELARIAAQLSLPAMT